MKRVIKVNNIRYLDVYFMFTPATLTVSQPGNKKINDVPTPINDRTAQIVIAVFTEPLIFNCLIIIEPAAKPTIKHLNRVII